MPLDPLFRFYHIFGFDSKEIKNVVVGEKYLAVLLINGQIGVCARLQTPISEKLHLLHELSVTTPAHRVFYQAYLNAKYNYQNTYTKSQDIFDEIDFSRCKKIVMVGYFKPLAKKFIEAGIDLSIFDRVLQDNALIPYNEMGNYLKEAQHVILTATSVFNNSFLDVIRQTPTGTSVYLLGPSTLLHPFMFEYRNVKKIYGSIFKPYDQNVLQMIAEGHGTRWFLPLGRKVYLENK